MSFETGLAIVSSSRVVYSTQFQPNVLRKALGLAFGTAGLRAQMGAGFARLNSLTIIQTSQGLAEYLLEKEPGAAAAGIVIGHDARHNSMKFAKLAAAAFTFKGIKVWWYEDLVHTPMVPFGVTNLHAAAGIMITASHNPAQDNGYKVYGSNGCQINSPVDSMIAASILENLEPLTWILSGNKNLLQPILRPMKVKYLEVISRVVDFSGNRKPPRFVYTPMHGVGLKYMVDAIGSVTSIDGSLMTIVEQQAQPDPDFSTVRFPNPEEKGALDLAMSTADRAGISLILANDPDADRFAFAEKVGAEWYQFKGDEVGILLADFLRLKILPGAKSDHYMLTSAVSSQMLSCMSTEHEFSVEETLTGFKWLGNRGLDLQKGGKKVHFAYEEALGYMIPDVVFDKDGIAAAMLFLDALSYWGSAWVRLQKLYETYGYFETMNTYWRSPHVGTTGKIFDQIRKLGDPFPSFVGDRKVVRWRDLTKPYDSSTVDHVPTLPSSTGSHMITCWLKGTSTDQGVRFTVRASGTEPKIKSEDSFSVNIVSIC